jgi:hypothetical protein
MAAWVMLAASASASAAPQPIAGTLDRPGYTVIALAANGEARTVIARAGRFSLVPPAETVTLHLRAPDGTYAGPVVLVPQAVPVRQAQAEVARAARKVKRAERNVSAARRRVNDARGGLARRRAATLLRLARRQLTRARRQLAQAKLVLADARLQAITLPQAQAGVARAARKVELARRNVSAAQRRVRSAPGGSARRRAAGLLRLARRQLAKARRQLTEARQLLAAKQKQVNQAILGVKAGAPLGSVAINSGAGYALSRVSLRVRRTWVDATRTAQAVNGVPIGAGNFGYVASRSALGAASGDLDVDGIPGPLDVDDDGDLVLDNFDTSTGARAAQAGGLGPYPIASVLVLRLEDTANSNAANTDVDAALAANGTLMISIAPGDPGMPAELDCGGGPNPSPPPAWVGGLGYCTPGGTGGWAFSSPQGGPPQPFPGCCDPDGDGFGALTPFHGGGNPRFFLAHGATTNQIRTGDVLVERVTQGGVERAFPMTVPGLLSTASALVSYRDSAGNSATVSYPVRRPTPGNPPPMGPGFVPGDPGTGGNGFPVAPGPDGNIVLTLTFWRPQRKPIPPETAAWIDIGGLTYSVNPWTSASPGAPTTVQTFCPPDAYATDDSDLTTGAGGLKDTAQDQPAHAQNTVSYSVNVTRCLQSSGARSWEPGDELEIHFNARNPGSEAADLVVSFRRP